MSIITHMRNCGDKTKQILKLAHNSGVVSTGEVRSQGIHHEYLRKLCEEGKLIGEVLDGRTKLSHRDDNRNLEKRG